MIKSLRKYKVSILIVWLICAVAFCVSQLITGALVSTRAGTTRLSNSNQIKEIEGYKSWTKVNDTPILMPKPVAAACAALLGVRGANSATNPHRDKYFTVYVNDVGRQAMFSQKNPKFSEGSVIVKEKLSAKDSQTPELLTVMIKKEKGFNPASGDWEYMVVDGTGTKIETRGNLENCQACHLANEKSDYIFRTYLSNEVESKLK